MNFSKIKQYVLPIIMMLFGVVLAARPVYNMVESPANLCQDGYVGVVANIDYSAAHIPLKCQTANPNVIGGLSEYYPKASITMSVGRGLGKAAYESALMHEVGHQVDEHTTPEDRSKLYAFLGIKTNGVDGVTDVPWTDGKIDTWKKLPMERLAESVALCRTGNNTYDHMKLVPLDECSAFLKVFDKAYADAPKPFDK